MPANKHGESESVSVTPLTIDVEGFLARHWQREHLFIENGLADFEPPVDADELAGLAMEAGVDARIVGCRNGVWSQTRGPLELDALQAPGAWSLLVQSVDHYWQEVSELFDAVPFVPRWGLDDVLMSYATDGGGAGPHFDNYDVFIIQGDGSRTWQLGQRCDSDSPLISDSDVQLLAEFATSAEYRLETGDVLYIPPGVAHRGVSHGESTSFSIGFRAPRLRDLLARWADNSLSSPASAGLLSDAGREPAQRPGEVTRNDLQLARDQLGALLSAHDPRWFGETITENGGSAQSGLSTQSPGDVLSILESGGALVPVPGARIAWFDCGNGSLLVFAAGNSVAVSESLRTQVETLCLGETLLVGAAAENEGLEVLLQWLLEHGSLMPDE
jgi:50S ribosomal protein L16 3-hydroxylase